MTTGTSTMQPPKVLELYLEISRYPILGKRIRARMREEIFSRHVIEREVFEREVVEKAIESQHMEGLDAPFEEEPGHVWEERLQRIRDNLTDFYFAYNLPHSLFVDIVRSLTGQKLPKVERDVLPFNAELAPWDILFAKGEEYESYPPEEKAKIRHHLEEIIVVLIKGMISDQLAFVGIAKKFFTSAFLKWIRSCRIGRGRIGGKAAGLLLAQQILRRANQNGELDLPYPLVVPDSYFIGADVFYDFHDLNGFHEFHNQKYKTAEQVVRDYPGVLEAIVAGRLPEGVSARLRELLERLGNTPLIVRSSSLLEDNFGSAFAGKYDSFFCPNQGAIDENLAALEEALKRIYASVYNPNALLYRQHKGFIDYDERMAILIQKVAGTPFNSLWFPSVAGVAFSRNPFCWSQKIRREDGFLRLVFGLGTRAVDRVSNDYPRIVALSHPHMRPEKGIHEIRKYSQHFVDVIDLEENAFTSLPIKDVISIDYPGIRLLAAEDKGDFAQPIFSLGADLSPESLLLTFDGMVEDSALMTQMRQILKTLESHYQMPIDMEFAIEIVNDRPRPSYVVHLLQCRPLASQVWGEGPQIPTAIPEHDKLFITHKVVPQGRVSDVRYLVYVDPQRYSRIPDQAAKFEVGRVIGRINKKLEDERFILLGPGRWGSSNIDLGVKVTYADIYNTLALVEIAMEKDGETPEVSYGTHFFQDLVESGIFPLALYPDDPGEVFNKRLLERAPNSLGDLLPDDGKAAEYVKVIDIAQLAHGRLVEIVMNADHNEALAYIQPNSTENRSLT
jgi:hypothetical protein